MFEIGTMDGVVSDNAQVRSPSRRTRRERTRRRERYLSRNAAYNKAVGGGVFTPVSPSPSPSPPGRSEAYARLIEHCPRVRNRLNCANGNKALQRNSAQGIVTDQLPIPIGAIGTPGSNASRGSAEVKPKDHLYKILVIGDLGTGKTSIIKRYVHQFFTQHYRATIGVDFALKVINWDASTLIRLQLWDIAGQERFGNMTRVYYKEAVGTFIVFDVTRSNTFESVANWKADLDSKVQLPDGSPIPCILLANKCDQQKEGIVNNPTKMETFCRDKGFVTWFETSAKDNINIEEAAKALIVQILENDSINQRDRDKEQFTLASKADCADKPPRSCSC